VLSGRPVVLADEFPAIGGAQVVFLRLLEMLRDRCPVTAILSAEGPLSRQVNDLKIPIRFLDFQRLKKNWLKPGAIRRFNDCLREILGECNPGLVLANSPWAATALATTLRKLDIRLICAVHASFRPKRALKRMAFKLIRKSVRDSIDFWIVVSQQLRDEVAALGIQDRIIKIIPNGIDVSYCDKQGITSKYRTASGLSPDDILVVTAGRLHPGKGQDFLIDAARRLHSAHPGIKLIIVGEETATLSENLHFTDRLSRNINELNLEGIVRLEGFRNDLHAILPEMDIFVSASREESFGLAVLEGMAAGLPIVASRIGGLKALVEESENGFLVDPGDLDGFVQKISRLAQDSSLRKKMGDASRRRASLFDWKVTAREWMEVFEMQLGSPPMGKSRER
jgi:glycosyltransferase involved in cell wall biosynthesis